MGGKCLETLKSQTDWIMGSTFLLGFCVNERVSKSSLHIYCTYMASRKSHLIVQNKLVYILMCVYCFFQAECQNHIRIVVKLSEELLLLCGTHAYKPKCRHYTFKVGGISRQPSSHDASGIFFDSNSVWYQST